MGSLDIKSDQKVSEQELEIANNESELMVDSLTTYDENDLLELISEHSSANDNDANELIVHSPTFNEEKASCSSSTSSSDFMLQDPLQESHNSHGETKNKGTDLTTESPPTQTMVRLSPTTEKYRIPSSAFARMEPKNIDGWGMASSESLFSIKMGLSFRNQDSINWRSGELDLGFGIERSPSHKSVKVGMIPELDETGESDEEVRHHKLGEEDKIQSLSEIGNNHEPINLNSQGDQENEGGKAVVEEPNSHFSTENIGSRNSFAFPILTADTNKGPSEPQLDTQPHSESQSEPVKQTEPSEPEPKPKATPPAASWTNCFGCCTFCS